MSSLQAALLAVQAIRPEGWRAKVSLIDNDAAPCTFDLALWQQRFASCETCVNLLHGHGNVGYGRGHNLSLADNLSCYHLILNPDVKMASNSIVQALKFMTEHRDVILLAPRVIHEDGHVQYLCRRFPTITDLFVRGFLPERFRNCFAERLARYEMHDVLGSDGWGDRQGSDEMGHLIFPPIVSGCFMLFRTGELQQLRGFDPRYFLYFEDYDLSLRARAIGRVAYVPAVQIMHFGGHSSKKGLTHIKFFVTSAIRFFNRFGWHWV